MKFKKVKFILVLKFCHAEAVGILQISGSPVSFYLLGKVS